MPDNGFEAASSEQTEARLAAVLEDLDPEEGAALAPRLDDPADPLGTASPGCRRRSATACEASSVTDESAPRSCPGPRPRRTPIPTSSAASSPHRRKAQTPSPPIAITARAAQGVAGAGGPLPHQETIERAFGRHDVTHVRAHTGEAATTAAMAIGAEAYATGSDVAFARAPDLHLAADEAAHVVQQRGGVQLSRGSRPRRRPLRAARRPGHRPRGPGPKRRASPRPHGGRHPAGPSVQRRQGDEQPGTPDRSQALREELGVSITTAPSVGSRPTRPVRRRAPRPARPAAGDPPRPLAPISRQPPPRLPPRGRNLRPRDRTRRHPAASQPGTYLVLCRVDKEREPPADARYSRRSSATKERKATRAIVEQGARANDLAGRLDGETVPVVASHVTVQTGAETTLRLYLGRAKGDPGRWLLVDMTPGLDSEHHALEYEGSTAAGALSAFDEENGYPDGAISLRVDPNPLRVQPHTRRLTTDGQTLLGSLSSKASMASLLLIVGAIAAAPFTGGGSLLVTTLVIGGATLGAAARALSQPRRSPEDRGRQQDRHRPRRLHHRDQLPQRRPGRPGDPPRPGPPRRQPRHPLPPLDHLALEGASGLLIGIDGADQIIAILESKAPPAEKSRLLLAVIANLMRAGRRRKPRDAEAETRQIRVGLPSFICRRQSDAPSSIVGESLCLNLTPHLTSRAQ